MNRLLLLALLAVLIAGGENAMAPTIPTTAANSTESPQTSSVIVPTSTTLSPSSDGRKLRCFSCPEHQSSDIREGKCYIDVYRYTGDQRKLEEECPSSNYMCGRASYSIGGEKYFYRGCINTTSCSGQEYCKMDQNKSQCDVACCNWDLCNQDPPDPLKKPHACYTCVNSHAYESCESGVTNCTSIDDLCVKIKIKNVYFKSCISQEGCRVLQGKCGYGEECNVHCCYGNLCNSGIILSGRYGDAIETLLFTLSLILSAVNTGTNLL